MTGPTDDPLVEQFLTWRARRSPYWRPGLATGVEPWVALAETNLGHLAAPCGRNRDAAVTHLQHWQAATRIGSGVGTGGLAVCVGAAVVDPRGEVVASWGQPPRPGAPRWVPLMRTQDWLDCGACRMRRWPGCWVGVAGDGCSACLPERERDDPRSWPVEPDRPTSEPTVKAARTTTPKRNRIR